MLSIKLLTVKIKVYFGFGSNLSKRKMTERGTKFLSRERAVLRGYRLEFSIWKDDGFGYEDETKTKTL